jgi:hypothetical protein
MELLQIILGGAIIGIIFGDLLEFAIGRGSISLPPFGQRFSE